MSGTRRPLRVVHVTSAPQDGRSPLDVVRDHPAATDVLAALHDACGAEVTSVWGSGGDHATITWRGVRHRFVPDGRTGVRRAAAVAALRPDVVHLHSFLRPVPGLAVALACPGARVVVQHHGEAPATDPRTLVAQRMLGRVVDAAAFTGAAGPDGQAAPWRGAGVLRPGTAAFEVLEAAPAVTPLDRGTARARTGVTGDPAVVWVGRLVEGKDPLTAVRAFAAAFADRPAARLWMLCTNRELDATVRAEIAATGQAGRIALVGPVPHPEVAGWLSACDIVLATSRREGSGYGLIEALACGCTPVVSDLAPHRAIAGPLGARFAVGDVEGAAAALRATVPLPADRVRAVAAEASSWATIARQLLAAYGW